jgi:hypothetical protein
MLKRANEIARARAKRRTGEVAERLKEILRGASIEVEESRILVSGRSLLKRWLTDPRLRFPGGNFQ